MVSAIYPSGGRRGEVVEIELVGKVESEGLKFWASDPGITFSEVEGKRRLHLADSCAGGAHWIRFYNAEGSALPQLFIVGPGEERLEKEPNDSIAEADEVSQGEITVNGRLEKSGDVDTFALTMKAGERWQAEVLAYQLDSPVDAFLQLVNANGDLLEWNHDCYASLDPRLRYVVEASGVYYLRIAGFAYPPQANSRFGGSAETVYRLRVFEDRALPSPVVEEPASLGCPDSVHGVIASLREEDHYVLNAEKEVTYAIKGVARALDSPLDPWLEVRDAEGKVMAKNDDSEGVDAAIIWKAPASGAYTVVLRDLAGKGGGDYHYELKVQEAGPTFAVSVEQHAWQMSVGKANEISLKVVRDHGHARPITVSIAGLPLEVSAQALTIPGVETSGVISLRVPASLSTFVKLEATDGRETSEVAFPMTGATTDAGGLLRNSLTTFLLQSVE